MYWTLLDVLGVLAVITMVISTAWAAAYLVAQFIGARRRSAHPVTHPGPPADVAGRGGPLHPGGVARPRRDGTLGTAERR